MFIEKLISKLKGDPGYKWDCSYTSRDLYAIMLYRAKQVMRGLSKKMVIRSKGFLFIGTNVVVRHPYLLSAGKNLILEDNVFINALSLDGIRIKDNVSIARDCTIICTAIVSQKGKGITIGNNTGINAGVYLAAQGGIEIGDNVIIGPGVKIFSENHNYADLNIIIKDQGVSRNNVVIKSNCWIGANATILAGVTIGEGCVVAAGSIVTKSMAPNSIIAGIPGKVLKSRNEFNDQEIAV